MAVKIHKVTEFPNGVLNQALEEQAYLDSTAEPGKFITKPAYDEIEKDIAGAGAAAIPSIIPNPTNVALGTIIDTIQGDINMLDTDPVALENTSTALCKESPLIFSEAQNAKFQQLGMKQAALSSPRALNISETPGDRRKLMAEELKQAMHDMPIPDVTTYAEGRKVTMPSEVISQANTVTKKKAMLMLEKIVGKELTAKVVLQARTGGVTFFQKPHLWLGQRLFFEMSKRGMWDRITPDPAYESLLDESQKEIVAKGIAALFSWQVADQLSVISRVRNIELDQAFKLLIEQVCEQARQEKLPKDYSEEYDDTQSLEQLIGAA